MQGYQFGNDIVRPDDPRFAGYLNAAYADRQRPRCLCQPPEGVPMYVSRLDDRYILKRLPNSGSLHHPDCDSYEPPPELSGLGEVAGTAIVEDLEAGCTALRLDFSLSKTSSRSAPISTGHASESVRTDGSRLTLRATLHYLWEEAQLNRWTPAMVGKRTWHVIHRHLLLAAADKSTKGSPLSELLFVPEPFSVERKNDIQARRSATLARLTTGSGGSRKLMLLIAEVKAIEPARYGHRMVVKHLPDLPFMLPADLHRRMERRFDQELRLWDADPSTHLLVAATFGIDSVGVASLDELCLSVTTSHWIPVEHLADIHLLEALTQAGRRFTKGLRYNLAGDRPLASVVLSDTRPAPVALYTVPPSVDDAFWQALDALQRDSTTALWVWRSGSEPMPPLPLPGWTQAEHR